MLGELEKHLRVMDFSKVRTILQTLISEYGWGDAKGHFFAAMETLYAEQWFMKNRVLLGILDCSELLGYDGDALEILEEIIECTDLEALTGSFAEELILRSKNQILSGGSTLFFDIDSMQSKSSAVLINDLVAARREEFFRVNEELEKMELTGDEDETDYFLSHLFRTSYCLDLILEKKFRRFQRFRPSTKSELLNSIRPSMKKLANELGIDKSENRRQESPISKRLLDLSSAIGYSSFVAIPRWEQDALFSSGLLDSEEFLSDYLSYSKYRTDDSLIVQHLLAKSEDEERYRIGMVVSACKIYALEDAPRKEKIIAAVLCLENRWSGANENIEFVEEFALRFADDVQEGVVNEIVNAFWEMDVLGCKECTISLSPFSFTGFEIAVELALEWERYEILGKLKETLETLPWSPGNDLGVVGARGIARILGNNAVGVLAKHATWIHPKFECGIIPDYVIVKVLAELGHDAIPEMCNHLSLDDRVNEGILEALWGIGNQGRKAVSNWVMDNIEYFYEDERKSVLALFSRDEPHLVSTILFAMLFSTKYGEQRWEDEDLIKWIDENVEPVVTNDDLHNALLSENLKEKVGVCIFLSFCRAKIMKDDVTRMLEGFASEDFTYIAYPVAVVSRIGTTEYVLPLMLILGEFPYEEEPLGYMSFNEAIYAVTNLVHELGRPAIENVSKLLKSENWKIRAASILVLGHVALREDSKEIIEDLGYGNLIELIFKPPYELWRIKKYELWDKLIGYEAEWSDRVIILARNMQ
ncbi:MAG: hypothetical protein ACXABD_12375 [Candidatus Thorarchaeota archaeon]|jgi:hypothetical protein